MTHSLNLSDCFAEAWRGFKGWWIPLCLVAALMLVCSQSWLVKYMLGNDLDTVVKPVEAAVTQYSSSARAAIRFSPAPTIDNDAMLAALDRLVEQVDSAKQDPAIRSAVRRIVAKTLWYSAAACLLICALHVLLVLMAKASVQTCKDDVTLKRDLTRGTQITVSYIILALIKIVPITGPCLLFFLPAALAARGHVGPVGALLLFLLIIPVALLLVLLGLYLYLRWYFTDYFITESSANPFPACVKSWRMTRGNLLKLAVLFAVTLATHVLSVLTCGLAEIPGRPFEYTLRAAAYRHLRGDL